MSSNVSAKPLVLVDGSSYIYRAFHALPDLRNSADEPTGAVHGVLNMLQRLLDDYQPDHVAVVFDAPGKTFRDDLFAEYKATRPPMPDDLRSQVQPVIDAIEGQGITILREPGVEADDVIGTLARLASRENMRTVISTSDKDMTQLVDEQITVVNTMSNTVLDVAGVTEKFGVPPTLIIDYLTLVGDSVDNIPGVPGVGPKTAVKWLTAYGDLEGVIAHAGEISGKVGERLRAALESLPLYRELVTIKCDVTLPAGLEALIRRPQDTEKLKSLYARLEMRSFLRRLEGSEGEAEVADPVRREPTAEYETVFTQAALEAWLARLEAAEITALDTETTSLDYMQAELVGISVATDAARGAYIPLAHRYPGAPEQLDRAQVLAQLRAWLENPQRAKVGHHIKYDAHIFANYGITLRGIAHDTMLESYVIDSTATRHDMDSVAAQYLGITTTKYEEVAGKGARQLRFDDVAIDIAAPYAAEDAVVTYRLHHELWPRICATGGIRPIYEELEQPLIAVLLAMEHTGVLIDARLLEQQSQELGRLAHEAEEAAHAAAGQPFNLGSPKQLQEILFDKLNLPVISKTAKGQPSTAENVLQELADEYELPRHILRYRSLTKLKSTYTDKLPLAIDPNTGRVHTSYHQAVAATGRLSSSEPNLQNIPIRTAEGRRIRQAFVAPAGYSLVAADYSQIELRIMAHLSGDASLQQAFASGVDVHRATAAEVFGVAVAEVDAEQRRAAKAINFGLIYGMSAFGLARQLGISRGDAQAYVERYFERYPGVQQYMNSTRERARALGYVTTVAGRRLYLAEIGSRNAARRQYAERSAINAPMQGTAADIIKRAMIDVHGWLAAGTVDARLIMQVHDELVLEVRNEDVAQTRAELVRIMESAATLSVPLAVDVGAGSNWDEAH